MTYDEIPEWIKTATYELESGDLEKLNYLRGAYIGHVLHAEKDAERIAELEEQLQLAFAYERERIARAFENEHPDSPKAAKFVRESEGK